jgi:hypothetical protein
MGIPLPLMICSVSDIEVIPKRCYREWVSPSRTLPRVPISSGKPFRPPGSGCGSDGGYLVIRGSDQGIPGVRRPFWDDLIYTVNATKCIIVREEIWAMREPGMIFSELIEDMLEQR